MWEAKEWEVGQTWERSNTGVRTAAETRRVHAGGIAEGW